MLVHSYCTVVCAVCACCVVFFSGIRRLSEVDDTGVFGATRVSQRTQQGRTVCWLWCCCGMPRWADAGAGAQHSAAHTRPIRGGDTTLAVQFSRRQNVCGSFVNMLDLPSVLWRCWLGGRKGIRPVKNMEGWWRWALVSPDGVAPSWVVGVFASDNLPLHRKIQKFSSGTGSSGWSRKKGRKTVVVCGGGLCYRLFVYMCFCCVRFSFFNTVPRNWLVRTSPKWPILCQMGRETLIKQFAVVCCVSFQVDVK